MKKKEKKIVKAITETEEEDSAAEKDLKKLLALTEKFKHKKVSVQTLGPVRTTNKWRTAEPKFAPKTEKPENTVKVGAFDVDPARQLEYENWLKDKQAEQKYRREQFAKRALIKAKKRFDARRAQYPTNPQTRPPAAL